MICTPSQYDCPNTHIYPHTPIMSRPIHITRLTTLYHATPHQALLPGERRRIRMRVDHHRPVTNHVKLATVMAVTVNKKPRACLSALDMAPLQVAQTQPLEMGV